MPSWTLLTALLMWSILAFTGGVEIGCIDWDAAENDQVCCKECHTGNFTSQYYDTVTPILYCGKL